MTDRLKVELPLYDAQIFLHREGVDKLLAVFAGHAAHDLDLAGGIRPYVFSMRPADGNVLPHKFIAEEM